MLRRRNPLPPEVHSVAEGQPANPEVETRVLLVSEENDDAAMCRYLLEQEGLKVVRAKNQREGLQMARREQAQLVIVDATLPDGGGHEFALALKLRPKLARVPVVLLSNVSENAQQRQVFAAWLRKPVRREKFCRTIRDVLELRMRRRVRQQRDRTLNLES
jgi:response regulator RpfG family c-di-GMP phosphodiesterase